MKSFNMNKLVRDKILEIMKGQGKNVTSRTLEEKEFVEQLKIKLKEELDELNEVDYGDKDHFINELADIQLLIDYLLKVNNISKKEIDNFQKTKLSKAGGFDKRIYVERVDLSDDDEWVEYYRNKGFEEIK
jgi:predicted house-cleaning noncanonical NTP pyrophosphatase (MazG superfamily)